MKGIWSFQKEQVLHKEEILFWISEQCLCGHNFIFNFQNQTLFKTKSRSKNEEEKNNGINMSN